MLSVVEEPGTAEGRSALVIATGAYVDNELARLRAPARDAADLAAVLSAPDIGGFTVKVLADRPAHEVRLALQDFLSKHRAGDLLVVYLSCHGVRDARGRLYFAAADTRKTHLAATGIESNWLLERLDECRARRQVLILDCCFSGAFAEGAKGGQDLDLQSHIVGHGRGRVVLTASRAGEYSFEGHALPGAGVTGSVFTAGLVEGLHTGAADENHDGLVSVEDAYDYAYSYVQTHHPAQTPQRWTYGAEGRIWLARNPILAVVPDEDDQASDNRITQPTPQPGAAPTPTPMRRRSAKWWRRAAAISTQTPGSSMYAHLAGPADSIHIPGWTLTGHAGGILAMTFSPNSILLATAGKDAMVRLWDTRTNQLVGEPLVGHTGDVSAMAFSPTGGLLATAGNDPIVRLWNPNTAETGGSLHGHTGPVSSVAFSPDGSLLATASRDATIRLWDTRTYQSVCESLAGHNGWVDSVAFSPDGTVMATVGRDKTVRLWDPHTGNAVGRPLADVNGSGSVAFSPDGALLTTAERDGMIRLWHPHTRQPAGDPLANHDAARYVVFSPDGALLATTAAMSARVRLWDTRTRKLLGELPYDHHAAVVIKVAFSPDSALLATVDKC